jgi:thiosulfate reductase cytochrome b subunit
MSDREARRHHWVVRLTHWVNVVALTVMVGSGLRIFNAYPAFARRGESFCCYPFEGTPVPDWLTFGGWLAGARNWHFAMMWLLVLNGLLYVGFLWLHGEWRDLVPRRGDARDALRMIRFYLYRLKRHPEQGKHNALQKLAYFSMPIIAAVAVLSGVAIWKPVQLSPLTALFGGYVWARYWHFLAMLALVVLAAGHIFMVFAVDPFSLRSMVTGRYDRTRSPVARTARPLDLFAGKFGAGPEEHGARPPDEEGRDAEIAGGAPDDGAPRLAEDAPLAGASGTAEPGATPGASGTAPIDPDAGTSGTADTDQGEEPS